MSKKREPLTFDADGAPVKPTRRGKGKIQLHNANLIRTELATIYRDMRAGRIDPQDGTRLAYVLNLLRQAYETAVLEARLDALEQGLPPKRLR